MAVAERESGLDPELVVASVADEDALAVAGTVPSTPGYCSGVATRRVGLVDGEGQRQLPRRVDVAEEHAGDGVALLLAGDTTPRAAAGTPRPSPPSRPGPPLIRTTTVRGLAAATSRISSSCSPGQVEVRAGPSSRSRTSRATTTATSHCGSQLARPRGRGAGRSRAAGSQPSRSWAPIWSFCSAESAAYSTSIARGSPGDEVHVDRLDPTGPRRGPAAGAAGTRVVDGSSVEPSPLDRAGSAEPSSERLADPRLVSESACGPVAVGVERTASSAPRCGR